MKIKNIKVYLCDHCNKLYRRQHYCIKHEIYCYKNPNRIPVEYELFTWGTLAYYPDLVQTNSYGVPNSEWDEPIGHGFMTKKIREFIDKNYPWIPRDEKGYIKLGMRMINGKWREIEGYKPPTFAPGRSWEDEKF